MAPSVISPEAPSELLASTTLSKKPQTKRHEEYQYLDLIQDILDHGEFRPDRQVL
jgi:thymidylate synthase